MPASAITLECAELVAAAYAARGQTEAELTASLAALGLTHEATIMGVDPIAGPCVFGFFASSMAGSFCALRGTDDFWEAFEDAEFLQADCPLEPGAKWEQGFGQVFASLTVDDLPLTTFCAGFDRDGCARVTFTGHSLGAPLALYAALAHGAKACVLFACPRPGNAALAAAVAASSWFAASESWANVNDEVPDWPKSLWPLLEYQHAIPLRLLAADTVTPPIPADWLSSHSLANDARLLAALP